jgi:tripartite-type tricarboxylate transporter receptor subunit TctC
MLGRLVGQKLGEAFNQTVIVENRPGAGGNLAAELVARAAPDGYTIYWITVGTAVGASLFPNLSYNILKDFAPVSQATSVTSFLVVHPSLPVKTVGELIALAKSQPGKLNYSSSGTGGSPHLAAEWFKSIAGVDLVHVPYKGTGPQLVDLLGGVVKVAFPTMPGVVPFVTQGKLRALAVSSAKRSPLLPDVPTMIEAGLPGYVATSWNGAVVPAGTPKEIVTRLNSEMVRILDMPDIKEKLSTGGADPVSSTPEQFGAFIEAETKKWAKVIKDAQIAGE